jgi:hypothetical protein
MRKDLIKIATELYSRPISDADVQTLRDHARRVAVGGSLAVQAREKEHTIIYASVGELYKKYPERRHAYVDCEEKTLRDMKLVMRYSVYAAVLDDLDYGPDRMFAWFRTIINAYEFGRELMEQAYRIVQRRAIGALGPEEAQALNRQLDKAIDVFNS